ncbi:MAG: ribonuclease PH [Thermodesulfobacteriota bacterium]|nr:MAG: ribonuclease PH [Thermodesulfobacteriota bacterium]
MASEGLNRADGRGFDQLRPVNITRGYLKTADGSVLISMGETRVLCTATVEDKSPPFLKGTGRGWVTAEYSMLPRSSRIRVPRESRLGRVGGRTHEIQRLIGRSLRAVCDLGLLGERTVIVDCDVLQADGGTRTASVTGAYVALVDTLSALVSTGEISSLPVVDSVAAVSVGIVKGRTLLDLNYEEDSNADVDMNVIMTGGAKIVEIQGTAEQKAFSREEMLCLVDMAEKGIRELTALQKSLSL